MVLMNLPLESTIASQLSKLKTKINDLNKKGNLGGLFSQHVLSDYPDKEFDWDVFCADANWLSNELDRENQYNIAAIGYSIFRPGNLGKDAIEIFIKCLEQLRRRDHFISGHISFPFQPITFLGLALGVIAIPDHESRKKYTDWLISILEKRRERHNISTTHNLFYKYIESLMNNQKVESIIYMNLIKQTTFSFLEWGNRRGHFEISGPEDTLTNIRARILELIVKTELSRIEQELSSLIFISVNESISSGVDKIVRSPNEISGLLRAFEPAMKRWRYDDDEKRDPIKWPIRNEERYRISCGSCCDLTIQTFRMKRPYQSLDIALILLILRYLPWRMLSGKILPGRAANSRKSKKK